MCTNDTASAFLCKVSIQGVLMRMFEKVTNTSPRLNLHLDRQSLERSAAAGDGNQCVCRHCWGASEELTEAVFVFFIYFPRPPNNRDRPSR